MCGMSKTATWPGQRGDAGEAGATRHTVDKGILELWPAPDAPLVLLGILVGLAVAVLSEGGPEVERVDGVPGPALVARLLPRRRDPVEAVKRLRRDHGGGYAGLHGRRERHGTLVARYYAIEVVRLGVARRLPQRRPAGLDAAAPAGVHVIGRLRISLAGDDGPRLVE